MYQLLAASSHWTGCPNSPGRLSVTVLNTVIIPPLLFNPDNWSPDIASLNENASLIWFGPNVGSTWLVIV